MSEIHIHLKRRVPKPEKRPTRRSAFLLWAIAAGGLVISALLMPLFSPLLENMNPFVQLLVANLAYYLPFVVLPVFLLIRRTPGLFEAYRPNPISLFNLVSIVILAVLGVFFVNDITVLWAIPLQKLGFNVFQSGLPAASATSELMLGVISVAVLPGICEEFLFRGAILSAFEGEGTRRAMRLSSLLFMLVHGSLVGMPTQLILGMVLASLVIWTDSIYAGLIYHTVHNAAALMLEFVQNRAVPAETAAQTEDLLTAIGGGAGMISLALSILITGAMIFFSLRMFRLRGMLKGIIPEKDQKNPLKGSEWAVLILGCIFCALLYAMDITTMLGGS